MPNFKTFKDPLLLGGNAVFKLKSTFSFENPCRLKQFSMRTLQVYYGAKNHEVNATTTIIKVCFKHW